MISQKFALAQKPVGEVSYAPAEQEQHYEAQMEASAPVPFDASVLAGFRTDHRDRAASTAEKTLAAGAQATETILQMTGWIQEMKSQLNRKEFSTFVKGLLQWVGDEARKYLDIAKAFEGFDLSRLVSLEPFTILKLRSKRYAQVVAKLREVPVITPNVVQELIRELLPKQPTKKSASAVSGWKQSRSGGTRYYNVILHDEETGLSIEQQAEAEGILPQRVIASAVAARYEQKSKGSVQVSEYRAAQLEELPVVVEHARNLDAENRRLMYQLHERDRRIADLESKLRENAVASQEEPNDVLEHANPCSVEPGISDEVAIASTELNEYLETQVRAITKEYTAEHLSQTAEATDYSEAEQESSNLATPHSGGAAAQHKDYLVEPKEDGQDLEPEPRLIHVGDRVKIVSDRQGVEFVGLLGTVKVANSGGCVVEVRGKTLWLCIDEIVLLSAVPQVSSEQEKDAAPAIKPSAG